MEVVYKNDTKLLFVFKNDQDVYSELYVENEFVWSELTELLTKQDSKIAVSFFPPHAQLEVFYHGSCRKARIPSVPGSVYNVGQTHHMMKTLGADTLVSTSSLVPELLDTYPTTLNVHTVILVDEESEEVREHVQKEYGVNHVFFVNDPFTNIRV